MHPDVPHRGLEDLFESLKGLRELKFNLSGVPLPATISCLHKLETLIIRNAPGSFPGDAVGAPIAEGAGAGTCTQNYGDAIPDSIFRLTALHTLRLEGDFDFSQGIGELTGLRSLSLGTLYLTSLPESLTSLNSLETLNLWCPNADCPP